MSRLSRRTLLVDLGRATLGAVVLGGVTSGCVDGDTESADDVDAPGAGDATEQGEAATGQLWQRASFGFVSAYVIVRDGEALVFDTGTGDDLAPLTDALGAAGAGWDAVSHVVISHQHGDHVGGLDQVTEQAPEAVVHGAVPDLDAFRDRVATAREVVDGDRVMDLAVVATPGHTPGHISMLDDVGGVLLVGDALVNGVAIGGADGTGVELSPPEFTDDADQAADSGRALASLTFDVALFGHGEPITSGADEVVADAVG